MYILVVCWGDSTTLCTLMAGYAHLWLATHHTPPLHHTPSHRPTLISTIHVITGVEKSYLKNQPRILHSRVSYETVAISLLYLYSKSCVAIMQHRGAKAASMLQNGISQNTKCDIMVSFPKSSHIYVCNFFQF